MNLNLNSFPVPAWTLVCEWWPVVIWGSTQSFVKLFKGDAEENERNIFSSMVNSFAENPAWFNDYQLLKFFDRFLRYDDSIMFRREEEAWFVEFFTFICFEIFQRWLLKPEDIVNKILALLWKFLDTNVKDKWLTFPGKIRRCDLINKHTFVSLFFHLAWVSQDIKEYILGVPQKWNKHSIVAQLLEEFNIDVSVKRPILNNSQHRHLTAIKLAEILDTLDSTIN